MEDRYKGMYLGSTGQPSQEGKKVTVIVTESRVVKQENQVEIRTHAGMRHRIQRKTVKVKGHSSVCMATSYCRNFLNDGHI